MKTPLYYFISLLIYLTFMSSNKSTAQGTSAYIIGDGTSSGLMPSIIELNHNRLLIVGYSSYGYDSSYTKMIWLDKDMNVTRHKESHLTLPLIYVCNATKTTTGFLMGTLEYSTFNHPFSLVRTDTVGHIVRHDYTSSSIPTGHNKIIQVVSDNSGFFAAYTSGSNLADDIYRLEGNVNDTTISVKRIHSVTSNNSIQIFNALNLNAGRHLITGTYSMNQPSHIDGVLMKLDSSTVYWTKGYNFGPNFGEIHNIVELENGNFAFVAKARNENDNYSHGYITLTDTAGANIWTKRISLNGGGIILSGIVETINHDLIIIGTDYTFKGYCLKFNSSGTLLWKKEIQPGIGSVLSPQIIKKIGQYLCSGCFCSAGLPDFEFGCEWKQLLF